MDLTTRQANLLPLYQRVLGPAWAQLPEGVREMHATTHELIADGRATVERGTSRAARVAATLLRFPRAGQGVPVRVHFTVHDGVETWTRTFADRRMVSRQQAGLGRDAGLIVETFGPFGFGFAPVIDHDRLFLVGRSWSVLGIPLPSRFVPDGRASEYELNGRFHFDVAIAIPVIGMIVHYRGWLEPRAVARPSPDMTDDGLPRES